jgi:hypothetical protein
VEFHLTKKQVVRSGQWLLPPPEGETVCYEEPLHADLFPQLMRALQETKWPFQFLGYYYRLSTKHGLIQDEVPASEHYKYAWRSMSQKYHGAALALQALESLAADLVGRYPREKQAIGPRSQPKFVFSTELYALRTHFATLLFLIRSLLDEFAALVQFLSGPQAKQFRSFADVAAKCKGDKPPTEVPEDLRQHLREECNWFWRMRDVRDYLAHQGFVNFHLVQSPAGDLRFYIHHRLDMLALAGEFMQGLNALVAHIDVAYARRVRDA